MKMAHVKFILSTGALWVVLFHKHPAFWLRWQERLSWWQTEADCSGYRRLSSGRENAQVWTRTCVGICVHVCVCVSVCVWKVQE
jgi:hypothetical protein